MHKNYVFLNRYGFGLKQCVHAQLKCSEDEEAERFLQHEVLLPTWQISPDRDGGAFDLLHL